MKINITKEQVGEVVKGVGNVALLLAAGWAALKYPFFTRTEVETRTIYIGESTYSGAVREIVQSSMLGSTKSDMIDVLKRDGDAEYYKSVIAIVKSNMLGSTKLETVKSLSEK